MGIQGKLQDNIFEALFTDRTIDILYISKIIGYGYYYTFSIEWSLKRKEKHLIDRSLNEFISYNKISIREKSNRVYFICG